MAQQEKSEKPKKRGMFEQIVTIYKFTAAEDKALPWITGAVFAAPIVVGIICGIVFHWGWVSWITLMILAVMIGLLLFTIVLTGYQGIYLIGEGNYGRVMQAMDRQEKQIKGVTAGSHIPVYRICVGDGPKQVRLKDLRNTVLKKKTYVPNNYTNPIMRKLHPRHRFALSKPQLITLNDRLHTLQRRSGMGIPKGMDPMKTHKVSRRAIRGR